MCKSTFLIYLIYYEKVFSFLFFIVYFGANFCKNKDYQTVTNIHYYDETTNKSDVYLMNVVFRYLYSEKCEEFSTVIWFHGGGLTGGNKEIPEIFTRKRNCSNWC